MEYQEKRTWAQIDLSALEHNYRALREQLEPGCKFLGVVKANAYGHGAVPVAKKLEQLGADYLAVACLDEAIELRESGIGLPILILGVTPPEYTDELLRYDITQAVGDLETAREYSEKADGLGKRLKVHIKVDTGMSRLGFFWETAAEEAAGLAELKGLELEGIFTHCAVADSEEDFTMEQFDRFLRVTQGLEKKGVKIPIRHCAASAAMLNYPCMHLDMVRAGIILYGHFPEVDMEYLCDLRPVMTLKTRIAAIRQLPAGVTVSYGRTARLDKPATLAVLPIGYADGFHRVANRGAVIIRDRACPIVGRVCMDLCMVDVTGMDDLTPGEEVIVFGSEGVTVEDVAARIGTIQYETLCAVSRRVPRVYK